jgi:trk system potassium uptake protein TrkH
MSVIALMLLVHFMATLALIGIEDFFSSNETNFISIMFEVMSALALVGLTTGITPDLTSGSKLVLCLVMFIGRLGPLTASYALQRRQKPLRYRLPVAPVRIG